MAETTMKNLAAKKGPKMERDSLSTFVRAKIANILTGRRGEEFVTSVVSLANQNPALLNCERLSLCTATLQAQALGLSLNQQLGQAWIIPYNNKKKGITEATFQIGYRGYIQLAIRSGQYRKINVLPIKEGELKSFDPLNEDLDVELIQNEIERAKTPAIGYYAMFEYLNGFRKAIYWTREKMAEHAKTYSPAYGGDLKNNTVNSFWSKDFDSMACKTMLRQLITKWGVMSVEMEKAIETDSSLNMELRHAETLDISFAETQALDAALEDDMPEEAAPEKEPEPAKEFKKAGHAETESGKQEDRQGIAKGASGGNARVRQEKQKAGLQMAETAQGGWKIQAGDIQCPKKGPDGNPRIVAEEDCQKCVSRPGCPAWSEEW